MPLGYTEFRWSQNIVGRNCYAVFDHGGDQVLPHHSLAGAARNVYVARIIIRSLPLRPPAAAAAAAAGFCAVDQRAKVKRV